MRIFIRWALCVLLLIPFVAPAETISTDLPDDFAKLFSEAAIQKLFEEHAAWTEKFVNARNLCLYNGEGEGCKLSEAGNSCANWVAQYIGNGICNDLPTPPAKVSVTAVRKSAGWDLEFKDLFTPVAEVCQFTDDFVLRLRDDCRVRLGIPLPTPPETGTVEVFACFPKYDNMCQAGPNDTVAHGTLVNGTFFPDGIARFKVARIGPFGKQAWYQVEEP